jgi:hypothetical protein
MKDEEEQETTAGEEEMGIAQEAGEEKNIRRPIDCCYVLA